VGKVVLKEREIEKILSLFTGPFILTLAFPDILLFFSFQNWFTAAQPAQGSDVDMKATGDERFASRSLLFVLESDNLPFSNACPPLAVARLSNNNNKKTFFVANIQIEWKIYSFMICETHIKM